jgi:hypothetical protein
VFAKAKWQEATTLQSTFMGLKGGFMGKTPMALFEKNQYSPLE